MTQTPKTAQLQIRVTVAQKRAIQRAAARAGLDMSSFVLSRVLSATAEQFRKAVNACTGPQSRLALAELNTWLTSLSAAEVAGAVSIPPTGSLTLVLANTIAAMVELACARAGVVAPAWTLAIEPLAEPVFGSTLQNLRLHLLKSSPAPFRRRNLFVDATLGDRV